MKIDTATFEGKAGQLKKSTKVKDLNNIPLKGPKNTKIEGTGEYGLYYDSEGNLTGGIGHLVRDQKDASRFINADEKSVRAIYAEDKQSHSEAARKVAKAEGIDFDTLPSNVQQVLEDMAFNMGEKNLSGFHNTFKHIKDQNWDAAADGMLNSKWSSQVGDRAQLLAQSVRSTGQEPTLEGGPVSDDPELAELEALEAFFAGKSQPEAEEEVDPELAELEALEAYFANQAQMDAPKIPEQAPEKPGVLDTASRMFTQGTTLGFGDEIGGLMQAGFGKVADLIGATNPYAVDRELIEQGFTGDLQPSGYNAGLMDERGRIAEMREHRPGLSMAAEGLGGLTTDLVTGLGPVASGALYGVGEGEGVAGRALGGAIGGVLGKAAEPIANTILPVVGQAAKGAGRAVANAIEPVSKPMVDRFNHHIAPGIKNIYTAISGNTGQLDVPVLEAMTRQKDLFFNKPVKQNTKAAQATVQEEITRLNGELAKMTKQISEETGDQVLAQFDVVADRLRQEADLSNSETLRRLADEFDDAVLSGDYEKIIDTYKKKVRNRRQYTPDGKISRYKGSNADIIEEIDMLFEDTNRAFIDDMSRVLEGVELTPSAERFGSSYREAMSRLRDLHTVDKHLDSEMRYVRRGGIDSVQLRDSLIGGAVGGAVASGVGADPYLGGLAGVYMGASGRRSVIVNNILGNLKNNMVSVRPTVARTLNGAIDVATRFANEITELGVNPEIVNQLNKSATGNLVDLAAADMAAVELMATVPELFDESAYSSEINGKVTTPEDMQREQVRINMLLQGRPIDRAKALSALNRDGTIYKPENLKRNNKIKPVKSNVLPQPQSEEVDEDVDARNAELRELQELEEIFGTR